MYWLFLSDKKAVNEKIPFTALLNYLCCFKPVLLGCKKSNYG